MKGRPPYGFQEVVKSGAQVRRDGTVNLFNLGVNVNTVNPTLEELRGHYDAVTSPPEGMVNVHGNNIPKGVYNDVRSALEELAKIAKGGSTQDKNDASAIIEFLKGDDVLSMPAHLRPNTSQMSSDVSALYGRIMTADGEKTQRFRVMKDYFLNKAFSNRKPMGEVLEQRMAYEETRTEREKSANTAVLAPR